MKQKNNAGGYERMRIGSTIRKWRNIKEIKQKDLAAALRMSEAAISNIENDLTDVTLSQIEDIAVTLDITIEKLFSDPQDALSINTYSNNDPKNQTVMERELIYALIGSIEKKDEQLKEVFNNVMYTMDKSVKTQKQISKS